MSIQYLQKRNILKINRRMIDIVGGTFLPPDNLLKPSALDYLIEIVSSDMFGKPLTPRFGINLVCTASTSLPIKFFMMSTSAQA
jgi:hypothetical protein